MRKITSDGREVEMTPVEGGVAVTLDGHDLGIGDLVVIDIRSKGAVAYVSTTPKIGLTKAEWETLKAEIAAALAIRLAHRQPTYEELVGRVEALHREYERAMERAMQGKAMDLSIEGRIAAAEKALSDYRASHPEEMAQRKADAAAKWARLLAEID